MANEIENNLVASVTFDSLTGSEAMILARQGITSVVRNGEGDYLVTLDDAIGAEEECSSCAPFTFGEGGFGAAIVTHEKQTDKTYRVRGWAAGGAPADLIWTLNVFRVRTGGG